MSKKTHAFILEISRGILRGQTQRRRFLFWLVVAVLAAIAAGSSALEGWLGGHPALFLIYWGVVFWLTLTILLLALYDLLAVWKSARDDRRNLKRDVFGKLPPESAPEKSALAKNASQAPSEKSTPEKSAPKKAHPEKP